MTVVLRNIAHTRPSGALLALVLVLALAGAADHMAAAYGPLGGSHLGAGRVAWCADTSPPEQPPENMAGHSKPVAESSACLSMPYVLKNDNTNGRTRAPVITRAGYSAAVERPYAAASPRATTSLIASDLGRQFTLVGARPSGTS